MRWDHLRPAGGHYRLYLLPGPAPYQLGASLHPEQLPERHHRHPAQHSQHPLHHPGGPGGGPAPGRGRCHLSDGVRLQPEAGGPHRVRRRDPLRPALHPLRPGGYALLHPDPGPPAGDPGRRPDPGGDDPSHHPAHHPGEPEDRPPVLPGGRPGPGRPEVAGGADGGPAQRRGRHRHRLHSGGGPHRGRVGRPAVHGGLWSGPQRLCPVPPVLLGHPHRGPLRLRQRAW